MCLEDIKTITPSCWGGKLCWIVVVDRVSCKDTVPHCLLVLTSELASVLG